MIPRILLLLACLASAVLAYNPPSGVRDPADQLGYEIDRAVPGWPASWLTGTTTATPGYYFISKDHPSATNTSNPYGHPDQPRKELAGVDTNDLAAGTYIYFDGGTYSRKDPLFNYLGTYQIGGSGTTANPIWFVGNPANRPTLARPVDIGYTQIDNVIFDNINFGTDVDGGTIWRGSLTVRPRGAGSQTANNIIIRHCQFRGVEDLLGASAITFSSSLVTPMGVRDFDVEGMVVYNCDIAEFGDWQYIGEHDVSGVYKDFRTRHVWVLDSLIGHVGGDGVAGSSSGDDGNYKTEWLWVAGNTLYQCGENAVDCKALKWGVFANNTIYGPMGEQQGGGIICHSGANSIACSNIAFINNRLYNLSGGLLTGGSIAGNGLYAPNTIFIGNEFHNMATSIAEQADANLGYCMKSTASTGTIYAVHNSMEEYEIGIIIGGDPTGYDAVISGNIFGTRSAYVPAVNPGGGFWSNEQKQWVVYDSRPVVANYNIYQGTPVFNYMANTRDFSYLQGAGLEAASLTNTDPLFTNAATGDLTLQSGSPAIAAGNAVAAAYAAYQSVFGVELTQDRARVTRPLDGTWDIGAYEYQVDASLPTLISASIPMGGTSLDLNFSEVVIPGTGGSVGWALSLSNGSVTASYASGAGTSALTYNLSGTVLVNTTATVSYTQPGDGIEDVSGNDLASIIGFPITNNSTQTYPAIPRLRDKPAMKRSMLLGR